MRSFIFILALLLTLPTKPIEANTTSYKKPQYHGRFTCPNKGNQNKLIRIVLDAGHGGEDFGTYSRIKPRQHEKYLTLSTAYIVYNHLKKIGYDVRMTRTKDETISLQKRVDFATEQGADLFVSLHYNSAPSDQANGIEVFYYKDPEQPLRTKESSTLAEIILKKSIAATGAKSRGVKHGNFKVIRETTMPAILVEGGFLTHKEELGKLQRPAYLNKIATSVGEAVNEYFHPSEKRG